MSETLKWLRKHHIDLACEVDAGRKTVRDAWVIALCRGNRKVPSGFSTWFGGAAKNASDRQAMMEVEGWNRL